MAVATTAPIEQRLAGMAAEIRQLVPAAEVRLFGSRARGQAGPDSDIDLLITAPDRWLESHHRFEVLNALWDQLAQADAGLFLPGRKARVRPHLQRDAGEVPRDLLQREAPFAKGRVVDHGVAARDRLEHHEVVQIPVQDGRQAQLRKLFALESMHDLRAPPSRVDGGPTGVLLQRIGEGARIVRRDPFGDYTYFRRAVRPNELFFSYRPQARPSVDEAVAAAELTRSPPP